MPQTKEPNSPRLCESTPARNAWSSEVGGDKQ